MCVEAPDMAAGGIPILNYPMGMKGGLSRHLGSVLKSDIVADRRHKSQNPSISQNPGIFVKIRPINAEFIEKGT